MVLSVVEWNERGYYAPFGRRPRKNVTTSSSSSLYYMCLMSGTRSMTIWCGTAAANRIHQINHMSFTSANRMYTQCSRKVTLVFLTCVPVWMGVWKMEKFTIYQIGFLKRCVVKWILLIRANSAYSIVKIAQSFTQVKYGEEWRRMARE